MVAVEPYPKRPRDPVEQFGTISIACTGDAQGPLKAPECFFSIIDSPANLKALEKRFGERREAHGKLGVIRRGADNARAVAFDALVGVVVGARHGAAAS